MRIKSDTIVLAFGRMNPVTIGHAVLVNTMLKLVQKYNADHVLYLTRTQDAKKNPLSVDQKVFYARNAFRGLNIIGATDQIRTFIDAVKSLSGKYSNLVMVAGSDRILEYKQLLDKYNGKEFTFKTILVVSAGDRDPDAEGAAGMSASKMRQAAADNDFVKFKTGCPPGLSLALCKKMFDDVRKGMGLNEHIDQLRDDYINERIFNIGDTVEYNSNKHRILYRGPNYVILDQFQCVWLKDIKPINEVQQMVIKPQDKLRAARIIGMALGYGEAETKNDPEFIVNTALKIISKQALNSEARKILSRMLVLATSMGIQYDEKLVPNQLVSELSTSTLKNYTAKAMRDTIQGKKDRNKGMVKAYSRLAGTNKPLLEINDDDEYEEDWSEEDLEQIAAELSNDDIINYAYDDDEFHIIDVETGEVLDDGEEDNQAITEVLSRIQRLKAKTRMLRSKSRRERGAKIALKRRSTTGVIAKRARRLAIKMLKTKIARKPLDTLTIGEKERLEKRMERLKPVITRLATKFMPKVRQLEKSRFDS